MTGPATLPRLRPGWLADDQDWPARLLALPDSDVAWFEAHWQLAAGTRTAVDTSWVTTDLVR